MTTEIEHVNKYDIHTGSMLERYECYARVMGDVSIENGEEWTEYQSKLQQHINKWEHCAFDVWSV